MLGDPADHGVEQLLALEVTELVACEREEAVGVGVPGGAAVLDDVDVVDRRRVCLAGDAGVVVDDHAALGREDPVHARAVRELDLGDVEGAVVMADGQELGSVVGAIGDGHEELDLERGAHVEREMRSHGAQHGRGSFPGHRWPDHLEGRAQV